MTTEADLILYNGKILTVDRDFSIREAVAIAGERILAVGSRHEVRRSAGRGTASIDLKGATVVPGLIDSHHHFTNRAPRAFFGVRLDQFSSVSEILTALAAKAKEVGPGKLIFSNAGNAAELLDEERTPTLAELDAVAPDNPVILWFEDGLRVNSRMMERAGITRDTPTPPNGAIGHDVETGALTGAFALGARRLILDRAADGGGDFRVYSSDQMCDAFKWAQRLANANGLTGIRQPGTTGVAAGADVQEMQVCQRLWQEGALTIRVAMDVNADHDKKDANELVRDLAAWGVRQPFGDTWLRLNGVGELDIDQSTDGMLLTWPYKSLPVAARGNAAYSGVQRVSQEKLSAIAVGLNRIGWRPLIHAGGDRAVDVLLEAYAAADADSPIAGKRWVLDHAHFGQPRHIEHVKRLDLVVCMQYHLYMYYPIFAALHGAEEVSHLFPARQWLDAGILVAGGSDYSKMPPNPWEGIYFFVTRDTKKWGVQGPEHAVTREQALRMYTWNAAYVTFEEHLKGSIEPGKLADLVVLSDDYLDVADKGLLDMRALTTIVGGKVVHQAPDYHAEFPDALQR